MESHATKKDTRQSELFAIYLVNFIGALGLSLVLPFLVFLVSDFGGNSLIYGLVGASFSFFQLIGAPLLGRYSDRVGRRKALLISQAGTFVAWCILFLSLLLPRTTLFSVESEVVGAFTVSLPLLILLASRSLDGLTGGNISVANAYLVDVSTEDNQARNFGRMASASNLGFILGPMIGGVLGATVYREQLPVLFAAAVALFGLGLIYWSLPEKKPVVIEEPPCKNMNRRLLGKECKDSFDTAVDSASLRSTVQVPGVPSMLLLYFLIFLAFNLFYTAFPFHAAQFFEWTPTELGFFFAFLSGVMIFVQGPVLKWATSSYAEPRLALFGCLVLVLSFFFFSLETTHLAYFAAVFFALGNGLMWPSFMAILGGLGTKAQQGSIQGIAASAGSFASILGLLAGGILYQSLGAETFALGATLFLLAGIAMFFVFRRCAESRA